jgi:hypothetical protein
MSPNPNILTLLEWADRLAAGESCADWERWLESSSAAQDQWRSVLAAHDRLAAGEASTADSPLGAELIAALVEGDLDQAEIDAIEAECLRSPALVDEIASSARFGAPASGEPLSAALETRLVALVPAASYKNGHAAKLPVARPLPPELTDESGSPNVESPTPIIRSGRSPGRRKLTVAWNSWQIAAAAGLLAVGLCALALWLATTTSAPQPNSPAVVKGGAQPGDHPQPRPQPAPRENPSPRDTAPPLPPTDTAPMPPAESLPPMRRGDLPSRPGAPQDPPSAPSPVPAPPPRLGPPPELAVSSARGVLLVDSGAGGAWQVGQGQLAARDQVRIASLPESWTTVEIPHFGTSIWSGAAAATLTAKDDQSLTVRLEHGKFALQSMPAGAEIRVETPGGQWLARAVQDYSTLAVVGDDVAPALFVPMGAVAVGDVEVGKDQLVRWQNGLALPPEPLAGGAAAAVNVSADNPLDPAWLAPPTAAEQKEWRAMFGKLVERLAGSPDAAAELDRLLMPTTHARQAALLAQWRIELVPDEAEQARTTWELLSDRRELVRTAAFRYVLALQPQDRRAMNLGRLARKELGPDLATRLANWLNTARQGQPPTAAEARELSEYLSNSELVVRQVAVSLLLHHTRATFQQTRLAPPDFDAAAPAARRAAAQQQWQQAIRRIYGRANAPAAIRPVVP